MRLVWQGEALEELTTLADRAPAQATAVVAAAEWLARIGQPQLGRVVDEGEQRYWPVPPQGIFYITRGDSLYVIAVRDTRRRRAPW